MADDDAAARAPALLPRRRSFSRPLLVTTSGPPAAVVDEEAGAGGGRATTPAIRRQPLPRKPAELMEALSGLSPARAPSSVHSPVGQSFRSAARQQQQQQQQQSDDPAAAAATTLPRPDVSVAGSGVALPPEAPAAGSRWWQRLAGPALTAFCLLGYGLALYVNSITGSLVGDLSPSQSILLLSAGRAVALAAIAPVLLATAGGARTAAGADEDAPPPPPPPPRAATTAVNLRRLVTPAYLAVAGNSAYVAYYALAAGGAEVSVLAPLVGLYSTIPIGWGLLFRGESRAWQKLVGIGLSFVAVLLLAFSGGVSAPGRPSTPASVALTAACFIVVFVVWGSNDTIAAAVSLDPLTTALSSLVGQTVCCTVFGFAAFVQSTGGGGGGAVPPFGAPHLAVMAANGLSMLAWLAFVRLGQLQQASVFMPVVSMYTYVPVLLGVGLRGEGLPAVKVVGLLLAGAAAVLVSTDWRRGGGAAAGGGGGSGAVALLAAWRQRLQPHAGAGGGGGGSASVGAAGPHHPHPAAGPLYQGGGYDDHR